jgi:hypothetical protein
MLQRPIKLTVSIVTYCSDPVLFLGTLGSLASAIAYAKAHLPLLSCELFIVENEYLEQRNLKQAESFLRTTTEDFFDDVVMKTVGNNLGYGRGHNIALEESDSDYHLVLNPDVSIEIDAIYLGLKHMVDNPNVVLASPQVYDHNRDYLSLCKRYPCLFDLLLRGFAPLRVKQAFSKRLSRYEMHELIGHKTSVEGVPIVSGCFMLMPTYAFRAVGGFDKNFFLYFEDFDLSLRLGEIGDVAFVPAMKIVHYGGDAAKKGLRHILLFAKSCALFYRKYEWRIF